MTYLAVSKSSLGPLFCRFQGPSIKVGFLSLLPYPVHLPPPLSLLPSVASLFLLNGKYRVISKIPVTASNNIQN